MIWSKLELELGRSKALQKIGAEKETLTKAGKERLSIDLHMNMKDYELGLF